MSLEHTFRDTEFYHSWAIGEILRVDDKEPYEVWVNDYLPYSDLNEWVSEESILPEINDAFRVGRLSNIKALSFLSYRTVLNGETHTTHDEFTHDRFDHSLVTGMVMEKMMIRNGIVGKQYVTGMTAAMTHDNALPAGGDAIKLVDPANLHEEDHWDEMLDDKSYAFLEKYSLSPDEVKAVIRNEGPLGEMLDIADRLTYTMKDVGALIGHRRLPFFEQPAIDIDRALGENAKPGNLYRDILIDPDSGRPYSNDPGRMSQFLKLRALMHYGLYMSPVSAGRDWVIAKFVEPFYTAGAPTSERPLTPQLLRQWDDQDLMRFLSQEYKVPSEHNAFFYTALATWSPSSISFSTQEEAAERMATMQEDPSIIVLDSVTKKGFSTGEDYLVKNDQGRIVTFKEAMPSDARYLDAVVEASKGTHIFYVDESDQTKIGKLVRQQRSLGKL